MSKNILIYSEKLSSLLELAAAAQALGENTMRALIINDDESAKELSDLGISVVSAKSESPIVDVAQISKIIANATETYACSTVLLASDRKGRLVAGYLAQLLGAGCIANVNNLKTEGDSIVCSRYTLGGLLVAQQAAATEKAVITVSPKAFAPNTAGIGAPGTIEEIEIPVEPTKIVLKSYDEKTSDAPDISEANILIIVGQGVHEETLADAQKLADKLGGLVACTKPLATDKQWMSEDCIVGISGQTCKPDLALLVGVSGQVQLYTGVRDARVIAAINTDEQAPIMELSDYSLVADSSDFFPKIEALV